MIKKIGTYRFIKGSKQMPKAKQLLALGLGQDIKNHFLLGFRQSGGQTDKGNWKKRKNLVLEKSGRNILVQGGHLRDSIHVSIATFRKIIVKSDLPYAEIHNEGGTITQTVTKKQMGFFLGMYKKTGNELWKKYAFAKTLTIEIPQREFIGHSVVLERKIEKKTGIRLERLI